MIERGMTDEGHRSQKYSEEYGEVQALRNVSVFFGENKICCLVETEPEKPRSQLHYRENLS